MAKRSQRQPSGYDRAQIGCLWGLINVFDFRRGRAPRRLLSDRKRERKQDFGTGHSSSNNVLHGQTEKCETVLGCDEHRMSMDDSAKTSVKELMEVEMFNDQCSTNQPNNSEIRLEQNSSKCDNPARHKRSRSCVKSIDMDISELDAAECLPPNHNQVSNQKPSDDLELERIMEMLSQISQRNSDVLKCDFHGNLDVPTAPAARVEEKLAAAIELVLEKRLSNSKHLGDDGNTFCHKDFMDALQTLSLNKGTFLKLIQNYDSILEDKSQTLSSLPEAREKLVNVKSDESSNHKHKSFFRRRSKSMDNYPLVKNKESEPKKIVILKPGPAGTEIPETDISISNSTLQLQCTDRKAKSDRNASQFSLTEIKRKIKHAMGKERRGVSPDRLVLKFPPKNKGAKGENFGWSSPNRNHFYTERFAVSSPSSRKGELVNTLKDKDSVLANENFQNARVDGSSIYIEARRHLSEMIKSDGSAEPMTEKLPKSLGRILSLPEYNCSPCYSPRKYGNDIYVTAQTRLSSPRGTAKNDMSGPLHGSQSSDPSPRRQIVESQFISAGISLEKLHPVEINATALLSDDLKCPMEDETFSKETVVPEETPFLIAEEIEETTELKPQEEDNIINIIVESSTPSIHEDSLEGVSRELDDKESVSMVLNESSPCFRSDLFEENQMSSPIASTPQSPVSREIMGYASHKMEGPSPVSILEPLFTDDDVSPPNTISRQVEKEIEPLHIHFEEQSSTSEQGICTRISLGDEESAFEYVEAVLLGSGLVWDEFLSRWISSYEILDSSLFDEVELFSSRPRHDQKLLFDSANESLKEVCEGYFGHFTGISQGEQNIRPVPKGMDLILEIWKRVDGHLIQHPQPHSLDQLVETDLVRSRKWMNLHSDLELIGFEMGEIILNELVNDFVTSLIDDISDLGFVVVQAESSTINSLSL